VRERERGKKTEREKEKRWKDRNVRRERKRV
jgi:hypothetical protein